MSEKKSMYQPKEVSLPTLMMMLSDVPSPNPGRSNRHLTGSEIRQPGIEMETVVNKLIMHLKKNNK